MDRSENWQKRSKTYERIKQGSPSLEWTSGLEHRLNLSKKYINFKNKKILDVGCGIGMFLSQFKELGSKVYGIDIDKEKIQIAKNKFKNVFLAPSEKLPFRKDTFDIIWLHEVIEHVDNDVETMKECFRVLKPGGKIVIFAPNRLWLFETHGIYLGDKYIFGNIPLVTYLPNKIYNKLTPHVRNYTRKKLLNLINGVSYKKVYLKGVFPGFDKLSSKIQILGKLIQRIFRVLEKTPLNRFGISQFIILEKLA